MARMTAQTHEADHALREALEANGQRFTEQRAAVYRYLCDNTEHPTADDIYAGVRGALPDISLATVYKALETLVSCGLASKLSFGDGSARFDPCADDHCHSRCLACGAVRDVPSLPVPGSMVGGRLSDDFQVQGVRLEVVGYCRSCAPVTT